MPYNSQIYALFNNINGNIIVKTTLEHEKQIRCIKQDISFHEIAEGGSLIPLIVEDEKTGEITEVTFCESISGGQDEIDNMPASLTLTRLKMIDGELHSFSATYNISHSAKEEE